jgi:hypothetical protein
MYSIEKKKHIRRKNPTSKSSRRAGLEPLLGVAVASICGHRRHCMSAEVYGSVCWTRKYVVVSAGSGCVEGGSKWTASTA